MLRTIKAEYKVLTRQSDLTYTAKQSKFPARVRGANRYLGESSSEPWYVGRATAAEAAVFMYDKLALKPLASRLDARATHFCSVSAAADVDRWPVERARQVFRHALIVPRHIRSPPRHWQSLSDRHDRARRHGSPLGRRRRTDISGLGSGGDSGGVVAASANRRCRCS